MVVVPVVSIDTIIGKSWPAAVDQVTDIDPLFAANNDVIATGAERIAGSHDHRAIARRIANAAHHFESAHHPGPE